jgi:hypothetical protein
VAAQRGLSLNVEGLSLYEVLAGDPEIAQHLPPERLGELLRPEKALGAIDVLVDRVLKP